MASTEVEQRRPFETAMIEIRNRAELDRGNSWGIAAQVADKILTAESVEDVIAAAESGPEDIADLVGTSFQFVGQSLNYAESSEQFREGGTGYYVAFRVVDSKGDEHTVTTGAVNVVFQLKRLEQLGVFDNENELSAHSYTFKSRPTKRGQLYWIGLA